MRECMRACVSVHFKAEQHGANTYIVHLTHPLPSKGDINNAPDSTMSYGKHVKVNVLELQTTSPFLYD